MESDFGHSPFFLFKLDSMEGMHILNLNVPHHLTECILRIEDFSVYNSILPIMTPTLQIQVPGFKDCVEFTLLTTPALTSDFVLNLNACNLNLQDTNCGLQQYPLPDGIYKIQYSVAPNEDVYVEVNHLRTTHLRLRLKREYSTLNIGPTEPSSELKRQLELLSTIEQYLEAAEAVLTHNNDCPKAMELYEFAKRLLDKMSCNNC